MTFFLQAQGDGQKDGKAKKKVGHWCLAPKKTRSKKPDETTRIEKRHGSQSWPKMVQGKKMIINFSSGWMT